MHTQIKPVGLRQPGVRLACSAALALLATAAQADPALSYSNYAEVYGHVHTDYSSPYLGQISFDVNGPDVSQYWDPANPNAVASANFNIAPGLPSGTDLVYDLVTSNGSYGYGYAGQALVSGATLHAQIGSSQVDATLSPVAYTPSSSVFAYANVSTSQQMYIGPTATHAAGSYGAILVGVTLDGPVPVAADGSSWANATLQTYASFTDSAGVSYQTSFSAYTYAGDASWTGSSTVYKKLLFQYGTAFELDNYLWLSTSGNGTADFLNTGRISSLELPKGATLDSGAGQAGLGTPNQLFGVVFNAATADDQNTNWDFGNNGGGFTPSVPVPEPGTWLLLCAGMGVIGWKLKRSARAARA